MQVHKHKSISSLNHFDNVFMQAFNELHSKKHPPNHFASILNRKFIITKYPMETSSSKTTTKAIKDRRRAQSKLSTNRQQSERKTQKPSIEEEILQTNKIKVIFTKKNEKLTPQPQRKQLMKPQFNVLPVISQMNFQSKEQFLRKNKKSLQLISKNKGQKFHSQRKNDQEKDKQAIQGWDNNLSTSRNLQSRQYYYEMEENNDLQYL